MLESDVYETKHGDKQSKCEVYCREGWKISNASELWVHDEILWYQCISHNVDCNRDEYEYYYSEANLVARYKNLDVGDDDDASKNEVTRVSQSSELALVVLAVFHDWVKRENKDQTTLPEAVKNPL